MHSILRGEIVRLKIRFYREEIKRTINMRNACYYSLEKMSSSRLLSKKLNVNT